MNKTKKNIKLKFNPNLSPRDMFKLGSFGGTYWRPIKSTVTGKSYRNQHLEFKWKNIPVNVPETKNEWIFLVIFPLLSPFFILLMIWIYN